MLVRIAGHRQFGSDVSALECLRINFVVFMYTDGQFGGEGVYDGSSNTVQAAGYFIASAAEFTACVKNSEDCFHSGTTGIGLDIDRNAASVIGYGDAVVLFDCDFDFCRKTSQRFIDGIIHDFPD